MSDLTHVDAKGRARMVDVGPKPVQHRRARASGWISLAPDTVVQIRDNQMKKGDVLVTAQIAGIQAAKRTPSLIPLCHPLILDNVILDLRLENDGVKAQAEVKCIGRTGVEMEALTAVSVALLTVYDMCKAIDKEMQITGISLIEKEKRNVGED